MGGGGAVTGTAYLVRPFVPPGSLPPPLPSLPPVCSYYFLRPSRRRAALPPLVHSQRPSPLAASLGPFTARMSQARTFTFLVAVLASAQCFAFPIDTASVVTLWQPWEKGQRPGSEVAVTPAASCGGRSMLTQGDAAASAEPCGCLSAQRPCCVRAERVSRCSCTQFPRPAFPPACPPCRPFPAAPSARLSLGAG